MSFSFSLSTPFSVFVLVFPFEPPFTNDSFPRGGWYAPPSRLSCRMEHVESFFHALLSHFYPLPHQPFPISRWRSIKYSRSACLSRVYQTFFRVVTRSVLPTSRPRSIYQERLFDLDEPCTRNFKNSEVSSSGDLPRPRPSFGQHASRFLASDGTFQLD